MEKAECLERAERCRLAAADATKRAALYVMTFGGDDDLAKAAMNEVTAANAAAQYWEHLAQLHPQSRDKMFRDQKVPVEVFGY